jgi:hypothetical protein
VFRSGSQANGCFLTELPRTPYSGSSTSENFPSPTLGEYKGIEGRRVFGIPYVSRDPVCYERAASGKQSRTRPGKLTQGSSELCPISFALLTFVLAMGMVALVLLLYYLLRRWL